MSFFLYIWMLLRYRNLVVGHAMKEQKEQWSSKLGFILATAGSAVGLEQIWKFPYVTGMNGGGAFFLLFVILNLLIGLPMLISEIIIGRNTGKDAIGAFQTLAPKSAWVWIGRLGVLSSFLVLTFYSVVGGWVIIYTTLSIFGKVISEGADYSAMFDAIIANPITVIIGLIIFTLINVVILSLGVVNGIERANKIMMPL